ncbi:uncharacterized protein N7482_005047 [Penicillium canariense]|uniref:HTH CENPB-type domain-containing protein n=1 Tax=Penicillium canariense TaxID=189055 RepID=A0A9W9I1S7_9EURO|nr:uncharacterized protein N7482_005047 [Penicillium canariense]KAJ5166266.1 hypothetical protein N7482_005047 [Penicillium canariense]
MTTPQSKGRAGISEVQKKALRAWSQSQQPRPTHASCIAWFQQTYNRRLTQSSISLILSKKYDYLDIRPASSSLRQQPPQWPALEQPLSEWLKKARENGEPVTGEVICNKARKIWPQITEYASHPVPQFSQGWLSKFKRRFEAGLSEGQHDGALPAAPPNQRKELQALRTICGEFKEEDIYNMDETGLLWRKAPFDALPAAPNELRKDRAHICLIVCTNCTGSDRIPIWAIGHKEMPNALRGVNLKAMGCEWRYNRQAWLDTRIMSEWLTMFYEHIGSRRVLLFLDNFHAHEAALESTPPPPNIHIQTFPANSPKEHQPLRLGIIHHLKQHYRKQWLGYLLAGFDSGQSPMQMMSLYHALCWITRNWRHDVGNGTVYKAFRKSTLVDPPIQYLTAPKLPDMTDIYNKVIRYNRGGLSTKTLEEWLNPVEEEFIDQADDTTWFNPTVDTSTLDEPVIHLPPQEFIPMPGEAISGIQTAMRYLLHQQTTTANDILYLETMEKVLRRKLMNDEHQRQHHAAAQLQTQSPAQAPIRIPGPAITERSSSSPAEPAFELSVQTPTREPAHAAYMEVQIPPPSPKPAQASIQAPTQQTTQPLSDVSTLAPATGPLKEPSEGVSYQPPRNQSKAGSDEDMEM